MAMTPNVSKTAYQNRRLGRKGDSVNRADAQSVSKAHLCVDFTVENPRFSRVWKLDVKFLISGGGGEEGMRDRLFLCAFYAHEQTVHPIYALLKR